MGTTVFASIVPIDVAQDVAKNYYSEKSGLDKTDIIFSEAIAINKQGSDYYYIFNLKNEKGFIIISAEDAFTPVIGYSLNNIYKTEGQPDNVKYWMNTYIEQIDYLRENNIQASTKTETEWRTYSSSNFSPSKKNNNKGVSPMCDYILWNQDNDWNMLCPEDEAGPGGNVYAGCVATAMSIIMYYWQYPLQGEGSYSYSQSPYGTIAANFGGTEYLFSNMEDENPTYFSAKLMFHCGVAVHMSYSADGSGSYSSDVANGDTYYDHDLNAINDHFGYENAIYKEKNDYSHTNWVVLIKSQLDSGYPVYYSGQDDEGGHAFVCSGYDDDDKFHFNFGWSGSGNGFYTLFDINGFHNNQKAVINFFPTSSNYDIASRSYNSEPVENFSATYNPDNHTNFEVNLEWNSPAKNAKSLTGYDIYRGETVIEEGLSASTTSYTDDELTVGVADYYGVRAVYSDGISNCVSEYVNGFFTVKFVTINPDNSSPIYGTDVTFNGETVTTGFAGASFSVPFGVDYNYTAEHDDYPITSGTIDCVYETVEYNIVMGEGIVDITENFGNNLSIYPNPSNTGIFNIEGNKNINNSEITIFDITGKLVYQNKYSNIVNLSKLNKGAYKLQVVLDDKKFSQTIIIN